jgi:hypothetical protein
MHPNPTKRRRPKAARAGSFYRRAFVTCVVLASAWAVIYYRGDIAAPFRSPAAESRPKPLDGAIIFSPFAGNSCRQSQIDNATGQVRDNGIADCDAAKAQAAKKWATQMAIQRQTAIRDSFVNR